MVPDFANGSIKQHQLTCNGTANITADGSAAATTAAAAHPAPASRPVLGKAEIVAKRRQLLGPNLATFFQMDPLHIVRGSGAELFDAEVGAGRLTGLGPRADESHSVESPPSLCTHSALSSLAHACTSWPRPACLPVYLRICLPGPSTRLPQGVCYLDCINNVSHVGHAHPRVAAAVAQQLHTLNTNSRYLHQGLVDYCEAVAGCMPDPLEASAGAGSGCFGGGGASGLGGGASARQCCCCCCCWKAWRAGGAAQGLLHLC